MRNILNKRKKPLKHSKKSFPNQMGAMFTVAPYKFGRTGKYFVINPYTAGITAGQHEALSSRGNDASGLVAIIRIAGIMQHWHEKISDLEGGMGNYIIFEEIASERRTPISAFHFQPLAEAEAEDEDEDEAEDEAKAAVVAEPEDDMTVHGLAIVVGMDKNGQFCDPTITEAELQKLIIPGCGPSSTEEERQIHDAYGAAGNKRKR